MIIYVLCFTSQGADGVRGLKGGKGEKVSDILVKLWPYMSGRTLGKLQHNTANLQWLLSRYCFSMYYRVKMVSLEPKEIWALRVTGWAQPAASQASEPFSLRYSQMEDTISTCVLILNLRFRVMMERQVLVERMDQKGWRVKLDPWEMREVPGYLVGRYGINDVCPSHS